MVPFKKLALELSPFVLEKRLMFLVDPPDDVNDPELAARTPLVYSVREVVLARDRVYNNGLARDAMGRVAETPAPPYHP